MVRQVPVGDSCQVVVVGVLSHSSIDEGPGEVVHRILLVLNRLGHDLSVEVIVHAVVQMGLNGEWLVEELLEKSSIHYDKIGHTQIDEFQIEKDFREKIIDLNKLNNKWYNNY